MPSSQPAQRLGDIVEQCDRVASYIKGFDLAAYRNDRKTADAVERCLSRISEACVKLGDTLDVLHGDVPWRKFRGLGNILRHRYEEVIDDIVWKTASDDLPRLRASAAQEAERLR